jgi:hypothetical protein
VTFSSPAEYTNIEQVSLKSPAQQKIQEALSLNDERAFFSQKLNRIFVLLGIFYRQRKYKPASFANSTFHPNFNIVLLNESVQRIHPRRVSFSPSVPGFEWLLY